MSNADACFAVIRRCASGECSADCNCDLVSVEVDVDELTAVEVAHFQAHGTPAQRATIAAYFAPEVPMSKPAISKVRPVLPTPCCPNTVPGRECDCTECTDPGWYNWCPEGCDCLVCLVDSLSANPRPRPPAKVA